MGAVRGHLSAMTRLEVLDEIADVTHVERELPDYTWPIRLPLDVLRRLIERESREAIEQANRSHLATR
jgi:hypothetical protein